MSVSISVSEVRSAVGETTADVEDCMIGDAPRGAVSAVTEVNDGAERGGVEERVFLDLDEVGFLVMRQ